jgi:tetratricopeptide (TPR) repeat protein
MNPTSKLSAVEAGRQKLTRLESFLREDPDNAMLQADAFQVALQCGEWDRARVLLKSAQLRQPGDPAWALREGDFWLAQQRYPEARAVLEGLAMLAEPGSELLHVVFQNLGHVDYCQGDYDACVSRIKPLMDGAGEAPTGKKLNAALQQLWLRALHRHADIERAFEWTLEAEREGRLHSAAAGVAALVAVDHGRFKDAQRWAELARASLDAPGLELLVAQASLALAGGDADRARQFADQALELNPQDGRSWSARAFADLLRNDLDAAAESFKQALTFMPEHVETWHGQGWSHVLRQDLRAAQGSFQSALALDRDFAESHGNLAVVLALRQDAQAAREHIGIAQRLDPNESSSRYAEAILSGEVRDPDAVQRLAQRMLGARAAPLGGTLGDLLPTRGGKTKG